MSLPINLDKMVNPDTHTSVNPLTGKVDATMAGKAYVGFSSTTGNTLPPYFGVFQLLQWTFTETPMCPLTRIKCCNSGKDLGQSFLTLFLKNIGTEKLFLKFKYEQPVMNPTWQWFDCRQPLDNVAYFEDTEIKLETSFYDPLHYGCNMTIQYDATVADVIIHDSTNSTWNSISRVYGTFDSSYLLVVSK